MTVVIVEVEAKTIIRKIIKNDCKKGRKVSSKIRTPLIITPLKNYTVEIKQK